MQSLPLTTKMVLSKVTLELVFLEKPVKVDLE